jgi:Tfp pilus assembly protein FimT
LLELIVTLAIVVIVVIVATLGIPGFQQMLRDNRLATQTNEGGDPDESSGLF